MDKQQEKRPLVILTGPTAVGKSSLSIALAKKTGGEIISADSMQVYRGMDIGSAKISTEEMEGVPHHLIDVLDPTEPFDVTVFQRLAKEAAEGIRERGHLPIVVGGTGFYIQALLYDVDFRSKARDEELRCRLEERALEIGPEALHSELKVIDPESAEAIPAGNVKRVIRAIEFYHLTGEKISAHNQAQRERTSPYAFRYFVLTDERSKLYERIDRRVDQMMEEGLVEEVKRLRSSGVRITDTSMQGLGYREIYRYLEGELTKEEALRLIKQNTRHYAKRQLTWFRRERDVIWLAKQEFDYDEQRILAEMLGRISEITGRNDN